MKSICVIGVGYVGLVTGACLADLGNPNLITDVGVAARFAVAALDCAALNLEINLLYIKDANYVNSCRKEIAPLLHEGARLGTEVWEKVNQHLKEGH